MTKPQIKVTCSRCAGTGRVANRTARHDARCFCCGGVGHYFRKAATKRVRVTLVEQLAIDNARIRSAFPHLYNSDGSIKR